MNGHVETKEISDALLKARCILALCAFTAEAVAYSRDRHLLMIDVSQSIEVACDLLAYAEDLCEQADHNASGVAVAKS